MEKRKHLFWSPCAAHCINLMLEDIASMKQIKNTLDQAKMITWFIYNSVKVVNLMKEFTNDRNLLRPGITHFATEFISFESLIRYEADLKRMYTTNKWREFNKDRNIKSLRDKVSNLILTDWFWKKAGEVQTIMEPLVKILKLVDQDKKSIVSIIYEARIELNWLSRHRSSNEKSIEKSLIESGKVNCTAICMLQVIKKLFIYFLLFFSSTNYYKDRKSVV